VAGIYLHIPYCKKACHYCNFHFSTTLKSKNDFVQALLKEMELRSEYLGGERVDTVYFGGGTPSLLTQHELDSIFNQLFRLFRLEETAEITLEANPDDINDNSLGWWKKTGINRLSIGVQSFFDEDLRWMNRAHDADQSLRSIQSAVAARFSLSIDLIYGSPVLDDRRWKENVEKTISLQIPHVSCYALTVEPRTTLDHWIRQQKVPPVSPETQARQFLELIDWLEQAGYEHYEISNFAKPGMRSRHNSAYWQGSKYLGLGPSAHSFDGFSRQWNVSNNARYIQGILNNEVLFEKEILSPLQVLNEYIMTSLRTGEGLDLRRIGRKFGNEVAVQLNYGAELHIKKGNLREENARLVLTRVGKLFADGIAADLFFSETDNIPQSR
jgi:oxygen-independent coproporphyrinogen-3 oxidase